MFTECPHCEAKVDCNEKGEVQIDNEFTDVPTRYVLLECKVCSRALLGFTELIQTEEDCWEWGSALRVWPAMEDYIDWSIPEIARDSLIQAQVCFKAKAYDACAVMCGRAIEGLCKHHDSSNKSLQTGLKKLKDDGVIDERIYVWGEALRKSRNLGAHATTTKVSKEDARDLLDFGIAICEYAIVLNEKFNRFQARSSEL